MIIYFALNFHHTICLKKYDCFSTGVCQLTKVNTIIDASGIERIASKDTLGLQCDIHEGFSFTFNYSEIINKPDCIFHTPFKIMVELRWPKGEEKSILEDGLNITNLIRMISHFAEISINLVNVKRFGCNIANFNKIAAWKYKIRNVFCYNCKLEFYTNGKTLRTCEDFIEANVTNIQSIFQIRGYNIISTILYGDIKEYYTNFTFINADFKHSICPLVFNNSHIDTLQLIGLVNSFYKKYLLSFSNHTFQNFTSNSMKKLQLDKVENIDLNNDLLNPTVFKNLESIFIFGMINIIDEGIFNNLKQLKLISFTTNYFRNIMHKNGINWIRAMNANISVDVSDFGEIYSYKPLIKTIRLECYFYSQELNMPAVFPDEDFCLYVDYPFKKLVLLLQICGGFGADGFILFDINHELSCTFVFLTQYYQAYFDMYYMASTLLDKLDSRILQIDLMFIDNIYRILSNPLFNSTMSTCNFTLMKSRCDKGKYAIPNIWSLYDYSMLNKKFEIAFKISSYLFSFLAIFTNLTVIVTILHKTNTEAFKGIKQYDYLCYNSIFSMLIAVIQLLSWMTECFYPYEVFCPEIRKLVFFQIFKMVFKECFVTAFRFMWNFTYIAFALNRISLIGKDHGKFVKFISEVNVKAYIIVSLFISCGCSVVKYFKYEINYDEPGNSYPISNELGLLSIHRTHISNDGVIIANSIFDILNYIVFELITFIIDIYMVVLIRRTFEEKMKKMETLLGKKSAEKLETMKKENQDVISKVIKMVVLNTAISVLFRLPIAYIPILNVFAEFYYKNYRNQVFQPKFGEFYSFFVYSGFYDMIVCCSDLLYTISIFMQLFIYTHFDRKFKISLQQIKELLKKQKK